jgi:hypothetical protein
MIFLKSSHFVIGAAIVVARSRRQKNIATPLSAATTRDKLKLG